MSILLQQRQIPLTGHTLVMGILNVTPDSFSDGGAYLTRDAAIAHALKMVEEGANLIDVGPESTRPGAQPVAPAEQMDRALPVIEAIREQNDRIAISIDTRSAAVAQAALKAGADMVNDVSALRDDPEMVRVVAATRAPVVLMHRRGCSSDMQKNGGPHYGDVISDISAFLEQRRHFATSYGIAPSRIIFDPGIGFGKRVEHNLLILKHLHRFVSLGQPVMVGASRKSFLADGPGAGDPTRRESGSLACVVLSVLAGVAIVRVHDVGAAIQATALCRAVREAVG